MQPKFCFNSCVKFSHSIIARPWKSTEELDLPARTPTGAQVAEEPLPPGPPHEAEGLFQ